METKSSSTSYGLDYVLDLKAVDVYFGINHDHSKSKTKRYPTDYNADGVMDLVIPAGYNKSSILFGELDAFGNLTFNSSSSNTYNPVIKDQPVTYSETIDSNVPTFDYEVVRSWEAPYAGTVNISGTASLHASVTGGQAKVAIQKNSTIIKSAQVVDATTSPAMSVSSVVVSKGDVLLFRTSFDGDGQEDLFQWDPQVTYSTSVPSNGAGLSLDDSKYSDGFLPNLGKGLDLTGADQFKVELNRTGLYVFKEVGHYCLE